MGGQFISTPEASECLHVTRCVTPKPPLGPDSSTLSSRRKILVIHTKLVSLIVVRSTRGGSVTNGAGLPRLFFYFFLLSSVYFFANDRHVK